MSERWAACLEHAGLEPLGGSALRLVESQEQVATVRLVGLAEQAVLEDLLEASKPRLPRPAAHLHYLLSTPFRYPPLKYGSRFGRRTEPSLFYGSRALSAVLAEAAYYRFVFWSGMQTAPTKPLATQHSLFSTKITTARGLRLQRPPFAQHHALLAHRGDERGRRLAAVEVGRQPVAQLRREADDARHALTPRRTRRPSPARSS